MATFYSVKHFIIPGEVRLAVVYIFKKNFLRLVSSNWINPKLSIRTYLIDN